MICFSFLDYLISTSVRCFISDFTLILDKRSKLTFLILFLFSPAFRLHFNSSSFLSLPLCSFIFIDTAEGYRRCWFFSSNSRSAVWSVIWGRLRRWAVLVWSTMWHSKRKKKKWHIRNSIHITHRTSDTHRLLYIQYYCLTIASRGIFNGFKVWLKK